MYKLLSYQQDAVDKTLQHFRKTRDPAVIVLGRDGVLPFLQQMQATLADPAWSAPDTDAAALRRLSHTMVNTAGQLGFLGLSNASRTIEAALVAGGDLAAARAEFDRARTAARPVLAGLISGMVAAEAGAGSQRA